MIMAILGLCSFINLLLFSALSSHNVAQQAQQGIPPPGPPPRALVWHGDKDGLISHVLQLKLFSYLAKQYNRVLRVASVASLHYGNKPMGVCDVFNLQGSGLGHVSCIKSAKPKGSCLQTLSPAVLASPQISVCYKGPLPMIFGAVNRKQSVLRAMNLTDPLPLQLAPKFGPLFEAAKNALGLRNDNTYTVVHWRRGDQLKTRCSYNRDQSVNCGSAQDLVRAVRKWSQDKVIYVATIEPSDSAEYKVLQNTNGFMLFANIKEAVLAANQGNELSLVDEFALEWAMMVDASTFVGFGLTEIKDVVEHERMLRNKTFCLVDGDAGSLENRVVKTAETGTWCDVQSGNYTFFKTPHVESLWLAASPNTSAHQTAGGIWKDRAAAGGAVSSLTKPAANTADSEDHRATAKGAQATLFQPLPKPPPPPPGLPIKPQPARGKKGPSTKHVEDRAALTAKVDNSLLAHYVSVLSAIKSAGKLEKKAFSNQLRILFVAGLEGTGHHALSAMMSVCMKVDGKSKCTVDNLLDSFLSYTHNSKEQLGLFFSEDAQRAGVLLAALEASMRNISTHAENAATSGNNRLYLMGLGYSNGVGMLSYPNFGGPSKSLNHPDAFLLATMAERVGLDLRVLVLQRSAAEILRSTAKRNFGGPEESRILVDNAAALYSQLRLLDQKFIHCIEYGDLLQLKVNSTAPSVKSKREQLEQFLHPAVVPPLMDQMLQKVSSTPSGGTATMTATSGKRNMSANSALSEFQLDSRLALIRDLCQAQRREN